MDVVNNILGKKLIVNGVCSVCGGQLVIDEYKKVLDSNPKRVTVRCLNCNQLLTKRLIRG